MGSITFDETAWPLVRITMDGAWTDTEFEDYLETRSRLLARKKHHVTVLDARSAALPPSSQRRMQASWLQKNTAALKLWSRGSCYVFEQPGMRFVLSGIFLIARPPTPSHVTGCIDEAITWARERMTGAAQVNAAV